MKNESPQSRVVKKHGDVRENERHQPAPATSRKDRREEAAERKEPYEDQMPNEILRVFAITLVSILGVALGALICWLTFEYLPK